MLCCNAGKGQERGVFFTILCIPVLSEELAHNGLPSANAGSLACACMTCRIVFVHLPTQKQSSEAYSAVLKEEVTRRNEDISTHYASPEKAYLFRAFPGLPVMVNLGLHQKP